VASTGGDVRADPDVRADGAVSSQRLVEMLAVASGEHERGVELLTVGQSGVVAAFFALGGLRLGRRRASFTLAHGGEEGREDGVAGDGSLGSRGGREYRISLEPADLWPCESTLVADSKLVVTSKTPIQGLAKALAARVAWLPQGRTLAIETALERDGALRRLRISKLAHAVGRVHRWQMWPDDPKLPTRPFRCVASLAVQEREGEPGGEEGWTFRLEVLPRGPSQHAAMADVAASPK